MAAKHRFLGAGPVASPPLYLEVVERVRGLIYGGDLPPGEIIDERALCTSLGISRTPLREALKVLAAEGLVELRPRRGCAVLRLDPAEMAELFPVIGALEGLAARLAVERCGLQAALALEPIHAELEAAAAEGDVTAYYEVNLRIHQAILELAGNAWLNRTATDLRRVLRLARHRQLKVPGRLAESLAEHRRLMDCFRRRDGAGAQSCMEAHLDAQWRALGPRAADGEARAGAAEPGQYDEQREERS